MMTSLNFSVIRRASFAVVFCSLISSLTLSFTGASHAARSRAGSTGPRDQKAAATSLTPEQAQAAYGKVGMTFERNQGQSDEAVSFLARGAGYTLFLTPTETVFVLRNSDRESRNEDALRHSLKSATKPQSAICDQQPAVLRMKLESANSQPEVSGLDELEGKVNYFIGSEPDKWHTNIPTFGRVHYSNVYEGVDMVYYGNQQQLEYDFVVKPGADYQRIALAFEGASNVEVEPASGDLLLQVGERTVRQQKPMVYQEVNGARQEIQSGYVPKGAGRVGFAVGNYDAHRPLIIDPVLVYSTYLGGTGADAGIGVAVDSAGNAYVTGGTFSANFPTANAYQETTGSGGGKDAFVTKLNAAGSALVYSTYLGGGSDDDGRGIGVDSAGNAYVTGFTSSTNFPTANAIQSTRGGSSDAFVTKLNAAGSALVYSTLLGGSDPDVSLGIAVDSAGNAYVTGETNSTNFPTANAYQGTKGSGGSVGDAFVTKLNAAGSALVYSTYLGGFGNDEGGGIAVDSAGNAYVTGETGSTDFPTANAIQATLRGNQNAFVTKLNAAGSALVYSTYLGGNSVDEGNGIAVDSAGNAYITGSTSSTNFPTTGAIQGTSGGGGFDDCFVTKLNVAGSGLVYSTYLGGSNNDAGLGITVDSAGAAYVAGFTNSANFPTTGAIQGMKGSGDDAFVTKLNAAGSALVYSTYLGGSGGDFGNGIALDSAGNAYVTGNTTSANFPTTSNAYQETKSATDTSSDAFIAKIGSFVISGRVIDSASNGIPDVTITLNGSNSDITTTNANGNFVFANTTASGAFTVTPFKAGYSFTPPSVDIQDLDSNRDLIFIGTSNAPTPTPTPTPAATPTPASVQFSASSFSANESDGQVQIIVTRSGDTSQPVAVDYATTDGTANDRGDYTTAIGRLHFAAGDTAESFNVFITDDVFAEGNETVNLTLSNPSSGAQIAGAATAVLTIVDNDLVNGIVNPIDLSAFFVRQHYVDFLNRAPDSAGLAFWTNNIAACGTNTTCRAEKRVDTSAAFFLSIEFQQTGFLVERVYQSAFNRFPAYRDFVRDTQQIGHNVVVGQGSWEAQLDANKQQFAADFVARPDFVAVYGGLSNQQYVDALSANTSGSLSAADRNALVAGLNGATETRASVLRKVSENAVFTQHELNRAFVLIQYFGYLRRNPNDAPDSDFSGYNFWLAKLNSFGGDFRRAEMVKAFIDSMEYRQRFAP